MSSEWRSRLMNNSRFWILAVAITASVLIAGSVQFVIPSGSLQVIRIEQIYGFVSLALIYSALMISPLTIVFARIPHRSAIIHSRRAIGVSGFYFAILHTVVAFFGQLGGFSGVSYLNSVYRWSLLLATFALAVLLVMTVTSHDTIIRKMTYRRWKLMHRTVYLAGVAIIVHFVLIGSHYIENSLILWVTYFALAVMAVLEVLRIRVAIRKWRDKRG